MGNLRTLFIMPALAAATACTGLAQAGKSGRDIFSDVVVQDRFFRGGATWPRLSIRTREPVRLDCLVYDRLNQLIAHKAAEGVTNQFTMTLGHLPAASKGVYLFSLVASDQYDKRLGVYPKSPGGGEIIQVKESELDPEKRTISYSLPRAACVRLRAGFREGPYLQPIISADPQPAGRHTVTWDGTEQAGLFTNLYQHPAVHVSILARSLPANILVEEGAPGLEPANQVLPDPQSLPPRLADLVRPSWLRTDEQKGPDFLIADDYELSLEIKENLASRTVEVRTDCTASNRSRLFNKHFELMLFLDTTFLAEDERSQLPFSYRMSTRGLAPGRHILTANVIDADSSVGTTSREFIIARP
jgi:hypothetical protein